MIHIKIERSRRVQFLRNYLRFLQHEANSEDFPGELDYALDAYEREPELLQLLNTYRLGQDSLTTDRQAGLLLKKIGYLAERNHEILQELGY